jgi:hypothetical protein
MYLRNLLGLARSPRGGRFFDLQVGEVTIVEVEPLGNWLTPGVTKAGRLSFSGWVDGQKVKVYSAHSKAQVALRLDLESVSFASFCFPEVVAYDDRFVVETWIDGQGLKGGAVENRAVSCDIITELHDITVDIFSITCFPAWTVGCLFLRFPVS